MSAAFQIEMGATYAGKGLGELSDLIMRRQRLFGETAKEAVIATGIGAMTSLRVQTRVADENQIQFKRCSSARVKWVTINKRREMKIEGWGDNPKYKKLSDKYYPGQKTYTYEAQIYKAGKEETILILADNDAQVATYLRKRIKRYKGMARSAWGHLMRMTSQREATSDPVPYAVTNVLRKNLSVVSGGSEYDYAVRITDDLEYAGGAINGGPQGVSLAMQAAANKISGRIQQFVKEHPNFSEQNIATPFPEIVKPR
jgi:hypothetical protein